MKISYACRSDEHAMARRQFLGTMTAAGAGVLKQFNRTAEAGILDHPRALEARCFQGQNLQRQDMERIPIILYQQGLGRVVAHSNLGCLTILWWYQMNFRTNSR